MTNSSQLLIYKTSDGQINIDVRLEDETVWLTQSQMAELFGKGRSTVAEHIRNVFREGELEEKLVYRNFRHTTQHGAIDLFLRVAFSLLLPKQNNDLSALLKACFWFIFV